MKIILRIFLTLIILAAVGGGCVYYAFNIEPYRVSVEEVTLGEVETAQDTISIVQFSDTHIKGDFTGENLAKVIDQINVLSPDIVVFTGDLYDDYSTYNNDERIISELNRITASVKKIAIWGNRDYGEGMEWEYESIMEQSGFEVLTNENLLVEVDGGNKILFAGIDDSMLGDPEMPYEVSSEVDYSIFLSHEPDVIEDYPIDGFDLILSGHTHGGQIDIPFLPFVNERALEETSLSSKYETGLTELSVENSPYLYINRGIGTTAISARFMVVPEVTEFTIYL